MQAAVQEKQRIRLFVTPIKIPHLQPLHACAWCSQFAQAHTWTNLARFSTLRRKASTPNNNKQVQYRKKIQRYIYTVIVLQTSRVDSFLRTSGRQSNQDTFNFWHIRQDHHYPRRKVYNDPNQKPSSKVKIVQRMQCFLEILPA